MSYNTFSSKVFFFFNVTSLLGDVHENQNCAATFTIRQKTIFKFQKESKTVIIQTQ